MATQIKIAHFSRPLASCPARAAIAANQRRRLVALNKSAECARPNTGIKTSTILEKTLNEDWPSSR